MEHSSIPENSEINASTAPPDPRDAMIAGLELRLQSLEKSVAKLENWQRKLKEGTEYLNLNFLHLQGMELQFDGKRRAYLSGSEDGAEFCLYDGDQQMRVNLAADSAEPYNTGFQLLGDFKRAEVLAAEAAKSAEERDSGAVNMRQYEEAVRIGIGPEGGLLALFDSESRPCVVARGSEVGGSIAASNKNGEAVAVLRSDKTGGKLQLMPDTWDQLGESKRMPTIAVHLEAAREGGICVLRENDIEGGAEGEKQSQGAFAALTARDNTALLIMGDDACSNRTSLASTPETGALRLQHQDTGPQIFLRSSDTSASISLKNGLGQDLGDWTIISDPQAPEEQQCAFYLKDWQGKKRLGTTATEKLACLSLCDDDETDRIALLVSGAESGLTISDGNGTERVSMHADPALLLRDRENRVVGLLDTNTGGRLSLFAAPSPDEDLESNLEPVSEAEIDGETESGTDAVLKRGTSFLGGPATRKRVILAANPTGAGLVLHGEHSEEQMLLSVGETTSHLQIKDRDGTPNLDLRASEEGGKIHVLSDSGAPRVVLTVQDDFGGIALMRSGGEFDAFLTANEQGGQLLLFDEYNERSLTLPDS